MCRTCSLFSTSFLPRNTMDVLSLALIFGLVLNMACPGSAEPGIIVNVREFGAVADGTTDNSKAFLEAWNVVCNRSANYVALVVPQKHSFLVNPVVFNGPCKAQHIQFVVLGRIVSPVSPTSWEGLEQGRWLTFKGVTGLRLIGPGEIDGRGSGWWAQSCRDHPGLQGCTTLAPTALTLDSCNFSSIGALQFTNSSQVHILLEKSNHIIVQDIVITAPETSPNTDGIHIDASHDVTIRRAIIGTGDDCVSIGDHTSEIDISYVWCGPGHGISIGSLGRSGNFVQVENIHVNRVAFNRTTNGARIKTWQTGRGYVRNVTFENMIFASAKYPVIIDQNYCDVRGACKNLETGVHISNVTYKNLIGTSDTDVAISLNCSRSVACTGLTLESILLWPPKSESKKAATNCVNVHGKAIEVEPAVSCLQNAEAPGEA